MLTDGHGKLVEFTGTMEIPADQETTLHDEWVIQERVYRQVGEATGRDGGSQTIHFVRRKGQTSTAPRLRQ
jgi:hypothetical protein